MACAMDGLRWRSRVHIHISKQSETLLITESGSSRFCFFSDTPELGDGKKLLSCRCRPRIWKVSHRGSRRVYCAHDSLGDSSDRSREEALAVVVRSLVAAGIEEEDAVRISLKCPHFVEKLVERSGEDDEIVRWANLSLGVEDEDPACEAVELSGPERWSAVLEFVGVHAQAAARISRVLSNSSLPDFLKKVHSVNTVILT